MIGTTHLGTEKRPPQWSEQETTVERKPSWDRDNCWISNCSTEKLCRTERRFSVRTTIVVRIWNVDILLTPTVYHFAPPKIVYVTYWAPCTSPLTRKREFPWYLHVLWERKTLLTFLTESSNSLFQLCRNQLRLLTITSGVHSSRHHT